MTRLSTIIVLIVVSATASSVAQQPASWPQFMGPDRNNHTTSPLTPGPMRVAWRSNVPEGHAGLAIAGPRLFTLGDDDVNEFVVALDTTDGRQVWRTSIGAAHATADPQSTPAVVGDTVVVMSTSCVVYGLKAETGERVWQRSLVTDFKSRLAPRGCGMSPLIDGANVVVPTGSPGSGTTVVSLAAATGQTVWSADKLPASLSTPISHGQFGAERLLLYHHAKPPNNGGLTALRTTPTGAAVAWQIDLPSNMSDTAALGLPDQRVLLQTWNDSSLIDASTPTPRIVWSTTDLWALYSPPAFHGGVLYGFGGNSTEFFSAVDIATGKTLWTERLYRGFVTNAGGTLVVLSESSGLLRLVTADATRYHEVARLAVFKPGARTSVQPSVAAGRIFVRNLDEIAAIETNRADQHR